jgi:hypothetical protein
MNHYYPNSEKNFVFCCIDNIDSYHSKWTKEIIKNISDFTISNLVGKKYSVLQSKFEDELLKYAADKNYEFAVVYSTGTEFLILKSNFYDSIEKIMSSDIFLAGHILDRKEGYYEIHQQCYLINLNLYKKLNYPKVGDQTLYSPHTQIEPMRSEENIHDDYTPISIAPGYVSKEYQHKAHGYNLISLGLKNNYKIIAFDNSIRESKKHYYPEYQSEFLKHINWVYKRYNYCLIDNIHKENTEKFLISDSNFSQILTPASGTKFLNHISKNTVDVILYDYNEKALEYWKENIPKLENINYKFLKIDLLCDSIKIEEILDPNKKTLINLSNIFCFDATAPFYSLEYRIYKENDTLKKIYNHMPNAYVYFSTRASTGFIDGDIHGYNLSILNFEQIKKPSWY